MITPSISSLCIQLCTGPCPASWLRPTSSSQSLSSQVLNHLQHGFLPTMLNTWKNYLHLVLSHSTSSQDGYRELFRLGIGKSLGLNGPRHDLKLVHFWSPICLFRKGFWSSLSRCEVHTSSHGHLCREDNHRLGWVIVESFPPEEGQKLNAPEISMTSSG